MVCEYRVTRCLYYNVGFDLGYDYPSPSTGVLAAGGTLNLSGTYTEQALGGTINVSTDNASATFTITGPQTLSGSGTTWSKTLATIGTYIITYGAIAGYTTPASEAKTLTEGSSITFTGSYVAAAAVA